MHTCICISICMIISVHMYICMFVYIYIYTCTHMFMYMYTCIYRYMYIWSCANGQGGSSRRADQAGYQEFVRRRTFCPIYFIENLYGGPFLLSPQHDWVIHVYMVVSICIRQTTLTKCCPAETGSINESINSLISQLINQSIN